MARPKPANVPPKPWWRSRSVLIALMVHAVLFLGLFQLHYTEAEWDRLNVLNGSSPTVGQAVRTLLREHGVMGVLTAYFEVHREIVLYHRYSELALRSVDVTRPPTDPAQGHLRPYRDVLVEYPPGALLVMLVPGLFTSDFENYLHIFIAWVGLLCLASLFLGLRLFSTRPMKPEPLARGLWGSVWFMACFGPLLAARCDFAVPLVCLVGAAAYDRAVHTNSLVWFAAFGATIACGVMVKIVPGVLLLAGLICLLAGDRRPQWKPAAAVLAGFLAMMIVFNAACYAAWGEGFLRCYTYHMDRGVQLESTYAGILAAAHGAGRPLAVEFSFGSVNLVTGYTGLVKTVSPLLFLLVAGIVASRFLALRRSGASLASPVFALLLLSTILLLAFMLTGKVFSPQYLLWIAPLLAVMRGVRRDMDRLFFVFLAAAGLTQVIYPLFYDQLGSMYPAMILLLNLRNALLVAVLAGLIWRLPALLQPEADNFNGGTTSAAATAES